MIKNRAYLLLLLHIGGFIDRHDGKRHNRVMRIVYRQTAVDRGVLLLSTRLADDISEVCDESKPEQSSTCLPEELFKLAINW